jgi:hypothetical protein
MSAAKVYESGTGWMYEVWYQGRVIIVGYRGTFEAATRAAAQL